MAASVAVGAAVVLARAAGERRFDERPKRRRERLGLEGDEPLGAGLRRMALDQLDLVLEQTIRAGATRDEKAIHETRKAIKRLRALLRLLEDRLPPGVAARETDRLREVARGLAGARDAAVMLATLERLLIDDPKLAATGGVVRLRRRLALEHAQAEREAFAHDGARARTQAQLEAMRESVLAWELPETGGIELAADGLRRIYGDGRRRYRRLASGPSGRRQGMRSRHELRKQVKDLRYAAEMLRRLEHPASATLGTREKKQAERLHLIARRADEIAEALGEEHDLGLLVELIERERRTRPPGGARPLGRRRRRALIELAERRRKLLRRRALRACKRLYEQKPKRFVRRADVAYRACAPPPPGHLSPR